MTDGNDSPFIEDDTHPSPEPPAGYGAYLVRDWDYYIVAQAEAVTIRDGTENELFFEYGGGGIAVVRRPRYPGELSHLFLPVGYLLPDAVARLQAKPVPSVVTSLPPRRRIVFRFHEEPLPPGAPAGSRAYRGDFETFVFTGLVTGITGHPGDRFRVQRGQRGRNSQGAGG
jgi:hypothetical protein